MIEHLENKVLTVFVLFVLKYFFDGDFLIGLLVSSKEDDSKGSLSGHSLEFVSTFAGKFTGFFLGAVFFLLSFKNLIGLGPELFNSVGGFGGDDFEVFSLSDGLLVGIGGVVLGIDVEELGFGGGAHGLFGLGFIEFRVGVLVDFGVDSAVYLFGGEIIGDLFGEEGFLHSHLIY